VASNNNDVIGPALVSAALWDKQVGRAGDTLRVHFAVDEALALLPTVTIDPAGVALEMTLDAASAANSHTYVFTYLIAGSEPQRLPDLQVTARLADAAGNVTTPSLGLAGFDFQGPTADGFDWVADKLAYKHDDVVAVSGTTESDTILVAARLVGLTSAPQELADLVLTPGGTGQQEIVGAISLTGRELTDGDELKVQLDLEDAYGNPATVETSGIVLDFTPPSNPSVAIDDDAASTASTQVNVRIDAHDATQVFLDGDLQETTNSLKWLDIALPDSRIVFLNMGAGARTVRARFRDAAGNESVAATDDILLEADTVGPSVMVLERLSPSPTNNAVVQLRITGTDNQDVVAYLVNEGGTHTASDIVMPFPDGSLVTPGTRVVTLDYPLNNDGEHTLYAWVKDSSSLVNSTQATTTVLLDRQVPVVTGFFVNAAIVNTPELGFTLTATDNQQVVARCITESATAPLATDSCFAFLPVFTLAAEGAHTLYPWARDAAGNVSAVVSATQIQTVVLDTVKPVVDSFTLSGSSPFASGNVPITLSYHDPSPSSGSPSFRITESNTPPVSCGTASGQWSSSAPTSYTATSGAHTLYAWVCDAAGNVSAAAAPQSLCVDLVAPTVSLFQTADTPTSSPDVGLFVLHVTDDCGVAKYRLDATYTTPVADDFTSLYLPGYASSYLPDTVTIAVNPLGAHNIYAWLLDNVGHISAAAAVTVTLVGVETDVVPPEAGHLRIGPDIASASSGDFVVVWQDGTGGSADILGRRFNASGSPQAAATTMTSTTLGGQSSPHLSAGPNDDYVLAFQDGLSNMRARFLHNDLSPYGNDILLTTTAAAADIAFARGAVTGAGARPADAVAVWEDNLDFSVWVARPRSDGSMLELPFQVGTGAGVSVAANSSGAFAIAWSDGPHVYLTQYTLDGGGALVPGVTQSVDATTGDDLCNAADVAMLPGGGAVVTWLMLRSTPSALVEVQASIVASSGTVLNRALTVASLVPTMQNPTGLGPPAVTTGSGDGGFVIAWTSPDVTGDPQPMLVQTQTFDSNGAPVTLTRQLNKTTSYSSWVRVTTLGQAGVVVWDTNDANGSLHFRRLMFDTCGSGC